MSNIRAADIQTEKLLLDPNNYRFQDARTFQFASENRFHEESVQQRARQRLDTSEKLSDLKRSIMRNGYIPVERIVVRPYEHKEDMFVVVEGNRRVAAVKSILADHEAGVDVTEEVLESIRQLPCIIVEEDGPDEEFRACLMGIRHVSGIKQWGGFQRARLIVEMQDDLNLDPQDVAERLALSTHEVNRRYRAYKALQQLQDDEEYGEHATAAMYPVFHEAVSLPVVRDWLGWNEDEALFENQDTRLSFYDLITPSSDDNGDEIEPKISGYAQVRELRSILPKPEARRILLDPHRTYQEAVAAGHQDELSRAWANDVSAALTALDSMGVEQLKHLSDDEKTLIEELRDVVAERLHDHELLALP